VNFPYTIPNVLSIKTTSVGVAAYPYCYDWEVSTPDKVCSSTRVPALVTVNNALPLNAKVFLEGAYDQLTGLMRDDLRTLGLVPLQEPYSALGMSQAGGGGGETTSPALLSTTGTSAPVDWVHLELRSGTDPTAIVAARNGLVLRNGSIVAASGGQLTFMAPSGNYYLVVRHRNHLGCMTATAMTFSTTSTSVDLSLTSTATYGTEARRTVGVNSALWMGNSVLNGMVKYTGTDNDRDVILAAVGGTVPSNVVSGYFLEDCSMDGLVKYTGSGNDRDPILQTIGGSVPTNIRLQQIP